LIYVEILLRPPLDLARSDGTLLALTHPSGSAMEPGTKLGHFEIAEQLGAGGMGEVCLAQDTRLGRKVAIKMLPEDFASDAARNR
jgi:serine/threonine protein kinase